jgi:hypothetical protein
LNINRYKEMLKMLEEIEFNLANNGTFLKIHNLAGDFYSTGIIAETSAETREEWLINCEITRKIDFFLWTLEKNNFIDVQTLTETILSIKNLLLNIIKMEK